MIDQPLKYYRYIQYMSIIGYIHICQKEQWQRSFTMLLNCIKSYGLYDASSCIRIGVVNDIGSLIPDPLLDDPKFKVIHIGMSHEYERPTLRHMRIAAEFDPANTKYYYLHTKGLQHFNTPLELCVIDWINLMLFWNIEKWSLAVNALERYNTYGCENVPSTGTIKDHYSGNFWWATRNHILTLPTYIGENYTDPELWIHKVRDNTYSVYNSGYPGGGLYSARFPRHMYENHQVIL